jgi:BON domain
MPVLTAKNVEQPARKALAASPVYALRELEVEQRGETLFISGSVTSFYHKQLAQEAVRQVAAGVEVVNAIHVR